MTGGAAALHTYVREAHFAQSGLARYVAHDPLEEAKRNLRPIALARLDCKFCDPRQPISNLTEPRVHFFNRAPRANATTEANASVASGRSLSDFSTDGINLANASWDFSVNSLTCSATLAAASYVSSVALFNRSARLSAPSSCGFAVCELAVFV